MKYLWHKYKILYLCLILVVLPLILLCFVIPDKGYEITLTGGLNKVHRTIEISNNYPETGSFNTTYVMTSSTPSLFLSLIAKSSDEFEYSKISESYSHLSNKENEIMGSVYKTQSITSSIIASYSLVEENNPDIHISYDIEGVWFYYIDSNVRDFHIGDTVTEINGIKPSDDIDLFIDSFNERKNGDVFKGYHFDGTSFEIIYDDINRGTYPYLKYHIDLDNTFPKFKIKEDFISGPSGGLLQALSVYNAITSFDYTYGKTIAGTGTIDVHGNVGEIGAIKQKIYTAWHNDVDIFFCPDSQYEEAMEAYNKIKMLTKMKVVRVKTLQDAINYLESLGD